MNYFYRYSLLLLTIAFSSSWAMETTNSSTQTSNSLQVTTKPKRSKQLEELYQQALKQNPFDKEWWQTLRIMASHPDGGYVCIQDILNYQINPNKTMNNAEYIRLLNSYSDKEVENKVNGFGLSTIKNFFLTINKTSNSEINEKNINHYKALIIVHKRINTLKNDILFSIALSALPEEILYNIKEYTFSNWSKKYGEYKPYSITNYIKQICPFKPKSVLANFSQEQYTQLTFSGIKKINDQLLVKFFDKSTAKYKVFSITENTTKELGIFDFNRSDTWPKLNPNPKSLCEVENGNWILKQLPEENILVTIPLLSKNSWERNSDKEIYYVMNSQQHILKIDSFGKTELLFDLEDVSINELVGFDVSPNEKLVIIHDGNEFESTILDTQGNEKYRCCYLDHCIFKEDSSIFGITEREDNTFYFWSPEGKLIKSYPNCAKHKENDTNYLESKLALSQDEKYLFLTTNLVTQTYDSKSGEFIAEYYIENLNIVSDCSKYQIIRGKQDACFINIETQEQFSFFPESIPFPFNTIGDKLIGWDEGNRSVIEIDYPYHKETTSLLRSLSPHAMMLVDFLIFQCSIRTTISCDKKDHLHKLFLSLPFHLQHYFKELIVLEEDTTPNEKLEGKRDRSAAGLDINNNNIAKKQKPDNNASKE